LAYSSQNPSTSTFIRWAALIAMSMGIAFLVVYLPERNFFAAWSAGLLHADSLFPPRLGTIVIGVASMALVAYCAVMVRPRRRPRKHYDLFTLPLTIFVFLGIGYAIAVVNARAVFALALLCAAWIAAASMFILAARLAPLRQSLWLRVPFSMALAVVTLLLLESLVGALGSPRLAGLPWWLRQDIAGPALYLAAIVGGVVAVRYHDVVFPLVIAAFALCLPFAERPLSPWLTTASLTLGVGMLVVAALAAIAVARDPREPRIVSHRYRSLPSKIEDLPPKKRKRVKRKAPIDAEERRYLLDPDSSLMRQ